jgi:hypothetical protein
MSTGTSFTTKTTNPNPDFDTGISFTTKTTKPNPDFAKALRRFKSVESHPHAGRVKEKPLFTEHKLHTNWEGEYAHKWSSVFSQRHHEQARCCKTVCPEIPRRSCQETQIHEQKGNNTRTGDSLTSVTFHSPVWNTSYFAKLTF